MKLKCNECGKFFKVSPKNSDPECPKCGGVDVEPAEYYFASSRNYSTGPFDFLEVA